MTEIVSQVIPAEGEHGHWVPTHLSQGSSGGGSGFTSHRGPGVNSRTPVERLVHQRNGVGAAAAENDCTNRHAFWILPGPINRRTLRSWGSKTRIGMGSFSASLLGDLGGPTLPAPISTLRRWLVRHTFPPDTTFRCEGDVSEDSVS